MELRASGPSRHRRPVAFAREPASRSAVIIPRPGPGPEGAPTAAAKESGSANRRPPMPASSTGFNFYPVTAVTIVLLALVNDGAILSIAYVAGDPQSTAAERALQRLGYLVREKESELKALWDFRLPEGTL